MNTELLTNPLVKAAIEAMNARDRQGWLRLFADGAALSDDGYLRDLIHWSDHELFGKHKSYLKSINRVEDNGLSIYGTFYSDRWGEFETFMRFNIFDNQITRLDLGQVNG
ncbi:MAG: hypothetical protein ABI700_12935 [Chloroflexota bacterium]